MKITPTEILRLRNINFLMDELHDSLNDIYECLVDREISQMNIHVKKLITKLEDLSDDENLD